MNLFIHFECTVAAINLRMEKICWSGLVRTHRTLPLLSHEILFQTIHKQQGKNKTIRICCSPTDGVFFTNTPSRIEFVRVVCGSGRMNGMVWIDLPIKSAATNVLNGFKMSFWCVFLRPYLLDRPVVVCLSLHLHLLLLLLLRMLHIEHKLFIFIVVSYNFTTCLNAVAMLAINATHAYCVTYYFICCEGGRSSLNPNYIFSLFTLKKETCMYVTAHARMAYRIRIFSGFGTRASWRCLWTYGCNGKHMWILFFVVDLVRFKNCCTEKPKIFAIILTNRNRNRNADEKNRILHPCQGPRGMVNWW